MAKKLLIFGASGRTGLETVEYALKKGYWVTALVRDPGKLAIQSERLTVVKGSPVDIDDVRHAMKGCHAVISLLSALSERESFSFKRMKAPHTLEKSIGNAIQVMNELGIKRILSLSSIGVGDSYPYAPWFMKLMLKITNFKIVFADHNAQEHLLRHSDLDWTIARPAGLNNNELLGKLRMTYHETPRPFKMSRKQLAHFFIDHLESKDLVHRDPILSELRL